MRCLIVLALVLAPLAATADPVRYLLQKDDSTVGFTWFLGKDAINGRMPVADADLLIDLDEVRRTQVAVSLDLASAVAGFPFADQAMKGPRILDAKRHPTIEFRSRSVTRVGDGARVDGDLTVRGVTRPVTLSAELYRQRGTAPDDLSRLSILLKGSLSRSAFGADGWSDLAGDEVRLSILARMTRAE